ncbi:semaphorin-7A isoform X1 [Poecilia reticulata]|uniref:semaphorin-7A isoform X1 n=1 Tax=Poecilia reticulata TaxID=8081 RepID=UPI0007EB8A57|nr:PREDICTED: semaphorin-7A isoform X1 [Poecilia reticulata]
MKPCVHIHFCFAVYFDLVFSKDAPALGSKNSPRLLIPGIISDQYKYEVNQTSSVFSYREEEQELFVGGTDFVVKLNANNYSVIEKFPIKTTGHHKCFNRPCRNVITVIEKFQDNMFVCGTNGHKPKCWKLFPSVKNQTYEIVESCEGAGISPLVYTHNCLSLTVDGDLYAAAPLDIEGNSLQFRRKAGKRTKVWMYDRWLSEPTFISASWVKRSEDPDNEKIYIFFREKNSDHSPDADPWISRVARVCKTDEGGSKSFFQNMWTTFLKARLVCGFPDESLYFNRLQDIYVMHADDWRQTRVFALFTSSWNSTAVCIYSIEMIEKIFENSTFKGYAKEIPTPRPGTCVSNSKSLPRATVNVVKDHPEMVDWVHSLHSKAPFYVSNYNYTKIVVDRVQGADQQVYNVLLLATDTGKIHKVLEAGSEPFIILETQISKISSIQAMTLDSQKKKLVVGFSDKISTVDLQKCEEYNASCADCVLARDPYCAWTTSGCTPSNLGGIQNIKDGHTSVCYTPANESRGLTRSKRQIRSPESSGTVHSVPEGVPFYLSCPIESYHAKYTWKHGSHDRPCLQMLSNCLHLIPSMGPENYGEYECVSTEKEYNKSLKKYLLKQQYEKQDGRSADYKPNDAPVLAPELLWIILYTAVVWEILR